MKHWMMALVLGATCLMVASCYRMTDGHNNLIVDSVAGSMDGGWWDVQMTVTRGGWQYMGGDPYFQIDKLSETTVSMRFRLLLGSKRVELTVPCVTVAGEPYDVTFDETVEEVVFSDESATEEKQVAQVRVHGYVMDEYLADRPVSRASLAAPYVPYHVFQVEAVIGFDDGTTEKIRVERQ